MEITIPQVTLLEGIPPAQLSVGKEYNKHATITYLAWEDREMFYLQNVRYNTVIKGISN